MSPFYNVSSQSNITEADNSVTPVNITEAGNPDTPINIARDQIHRSDLVMSGPGTLMWINGTQPMMALSDESALPNSSFPFARLASARSADRAATFVYHQINGTTFAEEQRDLTVGTWLDTEYINV